MAGVLAPRVEANYDAAVQELLADFRRLGGEDAPSVATAETLIEACRRRGLAASVFHPLALDVDFARAVVEAGRGPSGGDGPGCPAAHTHPAAVAMAAALAAVRVVNAQQRELGRRLTLQRQLLFCFKVIYRSDETREELVSILVDPLTEAASVVPGLSAAVDSELEGGLPWPGYVLNRLYAKACDQLRPIVTVRGRWLELEAQRRLERDMARLEEYYRGLREEALEPLARELHRIEAARNRARLWRSIGLQRGSKAAQASDEAGVGGVIDPGGVADAQVAAVEAKVQETLAHLAADRERRVQELREKYTVSAEVALVAAASVWTPRVEVRLKVSGTTRRELVFFYDPIRRRVLDLNCEACDAPLTESYLCADGELVCPQCFAPCASCGKPLCPNCARQRCHVCDALLCGCCSTDCPLAGPLTPSPHVCRPCRDRTCGTCIVLAQIPAV